MMKTRATAIPYLLWMVIFILVPLLLVAYYAVTTPDGAFTIDYISQVGEYTPVLVRSVWLAFIATVLCLLIAYPLAFIISRKSGSGQRTMVMLVMLPTWMTILEKNGLINRFLAQFGIGPLEMINTQGAVVLGMVYNYLPFMILPLYSVMTKIPNALIEAAQDLGCNGVQVLIRVLLPLTLPGISTGIIQVFVPSVSTFIISRMLGGGGNLLIGDLIDLQFLGNAYNPNLGAAISLVLMVMILLCMSITNQFGDEEKGEMLK